MARGKHAVASTNRANQAARDHIDRLTDQLADAKLRARQHEASTRQVPVLRAEVARLREIADGSESPARDEAEALREELRLERSWTREKQELIVKWIRWMYRNGHMDRVQMANEDFPLLGWALGVDDVGLQAALTGAKPSEVIVKTSRREKEHQGALKYDAAVEAIRAALWNYDDDSLPLAQRLQEMAQAIDGFATSADRWADA